MDEENSSRGVTEFTFLAAALSPPVGRTYLRKTLSHQRHFTPTDDLTTMIADDFNFVDHYLNNINLLTDATS